MSTYTLEQLREEGPPFAMALLLRCLRFGEPFVTYGSIRDELEYQLKIEKIFPTQIGNVAGSLMDKIHEIDTDAPLINALITRPDGMPGVGIGGYFANKYEDERYRRWDRISAKARITLFNKEREAVFLYDKWQQINDKLFGKKAITSLRKPTSSEVDGRSNDGTNHGGPAESEEHRKLKEWIAHHPKAIGLRRSFTKGAPESSLLSGDTIDVLFAEGLDYVAVEVKSCRSNDQDFLRGIYQCVKYRAVKMAEHLPNEVHVRALLVTERELPNELVERAKLLDVAHKCIVVNKKATKAK